MPTVTEYTKYANLQMAAEALFTFNATAPGTNFTPADKFAGGIESDFLTTGNLHASKFTSSEAAKFIDPVTGWKVVEHISNTTTGFSGTLFQNNATNELVLSFRSTEFIDDAARDNEATNTLEIFQKGFAFGQIADMEAWYKTLRDRKLIPDAAQFSVTGYSLGGHLATAFNLIHGQETISGEQKRIGQVVNFNGAGLGTIGDGSLTTTRTRLPEMVRYFDDLRTNGAPALIQELESERGRAAYRDLSVFLALTRGVPGEDPEPLLDIVNAMRNGNPDLDAAEFRDQQLLTDAIKAAVQVTRTAHSVSKHPSGGVPENPANIKDIAPDGSMAIAGESLDYQLAAFLTQRKFTTKPMDLAANLEAALGNPKRADGWPLSNQWDVVGTETTTSPWFMVAYSHFRYGQDVKVFIEDQPFARGNAVTKTIKAAMAGRIQLLHDNYVKNDFGDTHSLVLIVDSLMVQDTLLKLLPESARATAGTALDQILRLASWRQAQTATDTQGQAEGDVLESVVNALADVMLGPNADRSRLNGSPEGNTWAEPKNIPAAAGMPAYTGREALHSRLADIIGTSGNPPSAYQSLKGKLNLIPTVARTADDPGKFASEARKDFADFVALYTLSPFVLEPVVGVRAAEIEAALGDIWGSIYLDWQTDRLKASEGSPVESISDEWLADRVDFLARKNWFNAQNGNPLDPIVRTTNDGGVAGQSAHRYQTDSTYFVDAASGYRIAQGFRPDEPFTGVRNFYFADSNGRQFRGGGVDDRLYGGRGDDVFEGRAGNDRLEGNDGNDLLIGGQGDDSLIGGLGFDSYVWTNTAGYSGATNVTSGGGNDGEDLIQDRDRKGRIVMNDQAITILLQQPDGNWITPDGKVILKQVGGRWKLIAEGGGGFDLGTAFADGDFGITRLDPEMVPSANLIKGDLAPKDQNDNPFDGIQFGHDELGNVIVLANTPDRGREDTLNGSDGRDELLGLGGRDLIRGKGGDDLIEGGEKGDLLRGGAGDDRIFGGSRPVSGNPFDVGESGDGATVLGDRLDGADGNDILVGDAAQDLLTGGSGTDMLIGGAGDDVLYGDATLQSELLGWNIVREVDGTTVHLHIENGAFTDDEEIGAADALFGGSGSDWMFGGGGDDLVDGGSGDDVAFGGGGNDFIRGGTGKDTLGGDIAGIDAMVFGDDWLDGGDDVDIIYGDAGNDVLIGGKGDDTLEGGTGRDIYIYNLGDGSDVINDPDSNGRDKSLFIFGDGVDKDLIKLRRGSLLLDLGNGDGIHIENFDAFNPLANESFAGFQFADGSSLTWGQMLSRGFDLDGSAGDDRIDGTGVLDRLTGFGGDDILIGYAGNDTLAGGLGTDALNGGSGDDLYIVGAGEAPVDANGEIEGIIDEGGNDTLRIGEGIAASDLSLSLLQPYSPDHGSTLRVDFDASNSVAIIDAIGNGVEYFEFAGGDRIDVLTLIGATSHAPLIGTVSRGAGFVLGGRANDLLSASSNGMTVAGGLGNDTLSVTGERSMIWFGVGDGTDRVSTRSTGDAHNVLRLSGIAPSEIFASAVGGSLKLDVGSHSGDALLFETFDRDEPLALKPFNHIEFDNGGSLSYEELLARGFDFVGGNGEDVFVGTGITDRMSGGADNDSIFGGDGDDTLWGEGGNDRLDGGGGNDRYRFTIGDGKDLLIDTQGSNSIDFGEGLDWDSVTVSQITLGSGERAINLDFGGDDQLRIRNGELAGIQTFRFADGRVFGIADVLDRVVNGILVEGDAGDDSLRGYAHADTIIGRGGNDLLSGAAGNDRLDGGSGNDKLIGGDGDDRIDGGIGSDTLIGGAGSDTYVFGSGSGRDTVIEEHSEPSILRIAPGTAAASLRQVREGDDLILSTRRGRDQLRIVRYFEQPSVAENWAVSVGTTVVPMASFLERDAAAELTLETVLQDYRDGVYADWVASRISLGYEITDAGTARFSDVTDDESGVWSSIVIWDIEETLEMTQRVELAPRRVSVFTDSSRLETISTAKTVQVASLDFDFDRAREVDPGPAEPYFVSLPRQRGGFLSFRLPPGATTLLVKDEAGERVVGVWIFPDEHATPIPRDSPTETATINWSSSTGSITTSIPDVVFGSEDDFVELLSLGIVDGGDGNDLLAGVHFEEEGAWIPNELSEYDGGLFFGNGGDDLIVVYDMDNTLIGGKGRDLLFGGNGSDTYMLLDENAVDFIDDTQTDISFRWWPPVGSSDSIDTVMFGQGVRNEDLAVLMTDPLDRWVVDPRDDLLLLSPDGTGAQIRLKAPESGGGNGIEFVEFADGYRLTIDQILARRDANQKVRTAAAGGVFRLGAGDDQVRGGIGNDTIMGGDGDDTIDGGAGRNSLIGGAGNDVYLVDRGNGQQLIDQIEAGDRIRFDAGISPDEVGYERFGEQLVFTIKNGLGNVTVSGWDPETTPLEVGFADGTIWRQDEFAAYGGRIVGSDGSETLFGSPDDQKLLGFAGNDWLRAGAGADFLDGGEGNDQLDADAGDDVLYGRSGGDRLSGDSGDDLLDGADEADYLDGGEGNDSIFGGAGNDQITDGSGDDYVVGGAGDDLLLRRPGDDTYVFGRGAGHDFMQPASLAATGHDLLRLDGLNPADVEVWRDGYRRSIRIIDSGESFSVGGASGTSAMPDVIFADGTRLTAAEIDALPLQLSQVIGTDVGDVLNGNFADDLLDGADGNDSLWAFGGNDVLHGGAGDDHLIGGDGEDTLHGGVGNDEIQGDAGRDLIQFGRGDGHDRANHLRAPDVDADVLRLGAGIAASDVDVVRTADSLTLTIVDTGDSITFYQTGGVLPFAIEFADGSAWNAATLNGLPLAIVGSDGADLLLGDSASEVIDGLGGNDRLHGQDGNDLLIGGAGNDTIYGDAGDDELRGGDGDDYLIGGSGRDTYRFGIGDGHDTVDPDGSLEGEIDVVRLDDGLVRGDLEILRDRTRLNVTIRSTGERLSWNAGADSPVFPEIVFDDGSRISADELMSVELLIEGGDGAVDDEISGTGGRDRMFGLDGRDTLFGYGGNDRLDGGDGDDALYGGDGSDTLIGGKGNDRFDGGGGDDTILFGHGDGNDLLLLDWRAGGRDRVDLGPDIQSGDLNVFRSGSSLVLALADGAMLTLDNALELPEGKISVRFGASGEILDRASLVALVSGEFGTDDADSISGSNRNDFLDGRGGDDFLSGGGGNDTLDGGAGDDLLYGGEGNDIIRFGFGYGYDWVSGDDHEPGSGELDVIEFAADVTTADVGFTYDGGILHVVLSDDSALALPDVGSDVYGLGLPELRFSDGQTWGAADVDARIGVPDGTTRQDFIVGNGADNRIAGRQGADVLMGVRGDDLLDGGSGDDYLDGGSGDDTLSGGTESDSLIGGRGSDRYLFDRGSGTDWVVQQGARADEDDMLVFGAGIAPEDLHVAKSPGGYLVDLGNGDSLVIRGDAPDELPGVRFADGTEWSPFEFDARVSVPGGSQSDDVIRSGLVGALLEGLAGNDLLDAGGGSDVLIGGVGDDSLIGGPGDDTYVFGVGDGIDRIVDVAGIDTLRFGDGIASGAIRLGLGSLLLNIGDGDAIHIEGFRADDASAAPVIERFEFSDGSVVTYGELLARGFDIAGSVTVFGTVYDDRLHGGDGDDAMYGLGGNDTFFGGAGDDSYWPGAPSGIDGGRDAIVDTWSDGSTNRIHFEGMTARADLVGLAAEGGMLVRNRLGGSVLLEGFDPTDPRHAGTVVFADGSVASLAELYDAAPAYGPALVVPTARVGEDFTLAIPRDVATDDRDAVLAYRIAAPATGAWPGWLSFDPVTNQLGGRPVSGDAGAVELVLTAVDSAGNVAERPLRIFVASANQAPVVVSAIADQRVAAAAAFEFRIPDTVFVDADPGDRLSLTASLANGDPLPSWLSFDDLDGRFHGQPGPQASGPLEIVVVATDRSGATASDAFFLDVQAQATTIITGSRFADLLYGDDDVDDVIEGLAGADRIYGMSGNDTITGGPGADIIEGGAGDDRFVVAGSDSGDDAFSGGAGFDVVDGSSGDDTIRLHEFTGEATVERIDGRGGIDVIAGTIYGDLLDFRDTELIGIARIDGDAGNDRIHGSAAGDTIVGGSDADVLDGGGGDDHFLVAGSDAGADVFIGGSGFDVVDGSPGDDRIQLHTFSDDASVERIDGHGGHDLIAGTVYGDLLDFRNTELSGIAAIDGGAGGDRIYGSAAGETLIGGAGGDRLDGGAGDDRFLVVGADDAADIFIGGAGFDVVEGSSGDDTIRLNEFAGEATVERIDGRGGQDLIAGTPYGDVLDFRDTDLAGIARIDGEAGGDRIFGSSRGETIVGGAGGDVVDGGAGDDHFIVVGRDAGADIFTGGAGFDVLEGSAGDDLFRLVAFAGSATVERIDGRGGDDRIAGTTYGDLLDFRNTDLLGIAAIHGDAGNDRIHGSQRDDVIFGEDDDDYIDAGDGDDFLDGGSGDDRLLGGAGSDRYRLGIGSGADVVRESDATPGNLDVAEFAAGISLDQLWFSHVGSNLEVSVVGRSDKLTVENWYLGAAHRVEQFRTADRHLLLDAQVENLVQAMAAFAPPAAGETSLPPAWQTALTPVLAANWQSA